VRFKLADDVISPEQALWKLEAPKLVGVDNIGFVIKRVSDKDTQSVERVLNPASFLRYEIRGPVGNGVQKYLWLGTSAEEFMADPLADAPLELTALAERAFAMWLAWSHETEA